MQPEYGRGDIVRMRATPEVAGQIVGEEEWGARYAVRLAGSTDVEWFENVEIEPVPLSKEAEARIRILDDADNIIDFTRERKLRANTKTKGAA